MIGTLAEERDAVENSTTPTYSLRLHRHEQRNSFSFSFSCSARSSKSVHFVFKHLFRVLGFFVISFISLEPWPTSRRVSSTVSEFCVTARFVPADSGFACVDLTCVYGSSVVGLPGAPFPKRSLPPWCTLAP